MARAALVLAAGAAPVVGGGGQANAASPPPASDLTSDLGGLTALDSEGVDATLDDTVKDANGLVEQLGGEAVRALMPIVGPAVNEAAQDVAHTSATLLGGLQRNLAERYVTADQLTEGLPSMEDPDLHGLSIS
jgi:hypothetical protein